MTAPQETPRTDAHYAERLKKGGKQKHAGFVRIEFARKLERDLSSAHARVRELECRTTGHIELTNFVNAANISADDAPHKVVYKLQVVLHAAERKE